MKSKRVARSFFIVVAILFISTIFTRALINKSSSQFDPSVKNTSDQAFSRPLSTLSKSQKSSFVLGKTLFHGVSNDNRSLEQRGIGPEYNALTCGDCHVSDGRGNPETTPSRLIKLYNPKTPNKEDPIYGVQLQDKATAASKPEASIDRSTIGTSSVSDFSRGPLDKDTFIYSRAATPIFGMGLIEAIPDSHFIKTADPSDTNGDGISGTIGYIDNPKTKKREIGRFGWKATISNVRDQTLLAAKEDIGLSNSQFRETSCSATRFCVGSNDLTQEQEDQIVAYTRSIAPPRSRDLDSKSKKGKEIFVNLGCAACHTESIKLKQSDVVINENTTIHPMSDFLLHSMGPELADPSEIEGRKADEFRTAPLWGLGLVKKVNGSLHLMHDGRAKSFDQAILLHGGESENSKDKYKELSDTQKNQIIKYLETL